MVNGDSPWMTHAFIMWAELGKSAEEGGGARLVGEVGGLGTHWAGMRWREVGGVSTGEKWKEKQGVNQSKGEVR